MPKLIVNEFNNPTPESATLIRWYPFSGNLNDYSGGGHNLTAKVDANYGYATDFNGIGSCVDSVNFSGDSGSGCAESGNDYSVCGWYKGDTGQNQSFWMYDDIAISGNNIGLRMSIGSGYWSILCKGSSAISISGLHGLTQNVWAHVAITYDYSAGQGYYYRNGALISSASDVIGGDWTTSDVNAWIPGSYNSYGCQNSMLCDLRFYSGLLTANDVKAIYKYLGS